jgi:Ca-activated chloride channel family protein
MKTPSLPALALGLTLATRALADGLIVIHDPPGVPRGHYPFAPLEVAHHHVTVKVSDQAATTSVEQEFVNPNRQRLEGTYLFPVPRGAQVRKFTMEINGKPVEAELMPADKARKIYEDIVRKIKDPALLEYAGRDLFKVRVFPIEPNERKRIAITYSQLLPSEGGLVSYTYPLNTEKFSSRPLKAVSVKVEIEGSRPLASVWSPSHPAEIRRHGPARATVGWEAADVRPDTDFQVVFSQEAGGLGANLMAFREDRDRGFFALLVSPGADAKPRRPLPKDVVFVVDTSGSMAGDKLRQAKKALAFCVENLNDDDRFEIVRFSTESEGLFEKLAAADEANRARAAEFVKGLRPLGGTALDEALRRALALREAGADRPFVVIFLTDGQPTIGATGEDEIVARVTRAADARARVFCFGIGTDLNTHLLDRITEATRAASQYVLPQEDLELKLSAFFAKIREPVLSDLRLHVEGVRVAEMEPASLPDLFRGEQLVVTGRYEGHGPARLELRGRAGGEEKRFAYDLDFPERATAHEFVPKLWAARRVGHLLHEIRLHGEHKELREEITDLARTFGILTPYTSYLIVEDEARRNVPLAMQSLPQFGNDRGAREELDGLRARFSAERAGGFAVGNARMAADLKAAPATASAPALVAEGNVRLLKAEAEAAPAERKEALGRIGEYARQNRFVAGRNFFQNGSQWVDSTAQGVRNPRQARVQFGSPEYFDLVARHPRAQAWFALGKNLQVALGDTVYEIHE